MGESIKKNSWLIKDLTARLFIVKELMLTTNKSTDIKRKNVGVVMLLREVHSFVFFFSF